MGEKSGHLLGLCKKVGLTAQKLASWAKKEQEEQGSIDCSEARLCSYSSSMVSSCSISLKTSPGGGRSAAFISNHLGLILIGQVPSWNRNRAIQDIAPVVTIVVKPCFVLRTVPPIVKGLEFAIFLQGCPFWRHGENHSFMEHIFLKSSANLKS